MFKLSKASLVTAGGKTGKVLAVLAALPVAVAAAVVEGEVGNNTRMIVLNAAHIGQTVGELVVREAPHTAMTLVAVAKTVVRAAIKGAVLVWTTLVQSDKQPS